MTTILHVIAIGGPHQFAHFLPVAFEVARRGNCEVRIFVADRKHIPVIDDLASALDMPIPDILVLDLPRWIERLMVGRSTKRLRLSFWANRLRNADGILCAERTSTLLKRLPGRCPPMIHIPHGAGDRAIGFEKRISLFDKVLVAGAKDRDRLIADGIVKAERCAVIGPVKLATLQRIGGSEQSIFDNDRPVILYNPHFDASLASGAAFIHPLVEAVVRDGRYNLVVAPHIRLARNWAAEQRQDWEALAVPGQVVIDLGSRKSIDMSYTSNADLYIGDVSSQIYEFLVKPRPCLFVNAHQVQWEGDKNYAMWRCGEVVRPDCDISSAILRAFVNHEKFVKSQRERISSAFQGISWVPDGKAATNAVNPISNAATFVQEEITSEHGRQHAANWGYRCERPHWKPQLRS